MPKRANLSFDEISSHSMDGAIVPFPDDPGEPPADAVAAALLLAGYDEDNTPTSLPGLVREAMGLIEARPHLIEALKEAREDRLPPSRRANPRFLDAERRAAAALARLELRCEEIRSAMDFLSDDVFDLADLARLAELLQPRRGRWKR
ncbi:MAG: hypothetical protein KJZ92_16250 [Rhodocyclaceae bacterium]|nr:hypothetical protein [Rhodocyclaceae bacterium]